MTIAHPAPRPNTRTERALRLFEEHRHEIVLVGPDTYEVPSSSGSGVYTVEYGENESCSCPDATYHPERSCKHLLAVALCFAKRRGPVRYSETVEAARRDAAAEYRAEIRRMMAAGTLDDEL